MTPDAARSGMTAKDLHPFDAAVRLLPADDGLFDGRTHALWGNMVGPFGGITAATLLNAAWLHPQRLGEPLSFTVNFAGALADGPFRIQALPVRSSRTTQHWTMQLQQAGEVAATASAVFALRRPTWATHERQPPALPAAEAVPVTPSPMRVAWSDRYEMRFIDGPWPDLAAAAELPDSRSALWIRDQPGRPLDALSLVAMCDAFYPRIFRRRQSFTPAGTVSMTVHLHADAAELAAQGSAPVLACARGLRFGGGFFDQRAEIWGRDGRLLAGSQQSVWFKA